jgi:hypothetical protein
VTSYGWAMAACRVGPRVSSAVNRGLLKSGAKEGQVVREIVESETAGQGPVHSSSCFQFGRAGLLALSCACCQAAVASWIGS